MGTGWVGGVGAAVGFECTGHTQRKGPAVNQVFILGSKLKQEVSMPSLTSKRCIVFFHPDGWKVLPKRNSGKLTFSLSVFSRMVCRGPYRPEAWPTAQLPLFLLQLYL